MLLAKRFWLVLGKQVLQFQTNGLGCLLVGDTISWGIVTRLRFMRTQVAIIGGGPSGLLLSQLLHRDGIDTVVLERKSRDYVLSRIRAGVLEARTCSLLETAGVGLRMKQEGYIHDGVFLAAEGRQFRVDFSERVGKNVTVYGQTEVTQDLYQARDAMEGTIIHEVDGVTIHNLESNNPSVTFVEGGSERSLQCDFVAGCDGFHGVSRKTIPNEVRKEFEKVYPFGWLGVLSETPPVNDELIYANHERGFALCSMRNENLSRYYLQMPLDVDIEAWTDAKFWEELKRRISDEAADQLVTGPSIEKSLAPLRSFICEPMRWGNLFLVGDAAHIVPPTGAKGLNLAASDVYYLWQGLKAHYEGEGSEGLKQYSEKALARVWKASRFSWWMTHILHNFPENGPFGQRIQEAELAYLEQSVHAQTAMSENYVGLPY